MNPSLVVEIEEKKIGLDNGHYPYAFLSHSHKDHTSGIKKAKYLLSSEETRIIAGIEKPSFSSQKLRMVNAGHMLGAKQLVAEEDGRKTVYTGDIRIKQGIFGEKAEIEESDKLIIEATYANYLVRFPDPFDVYEEIARWSAKEMIKGNGVLFLLYSIGKAQEVIKVINDYLSMPVVVDKKTFEYVERFRKAGVELEAFLEGSEEAEEIARESFVFIANPSFLRKRSLLELSLKYARPFKIAKATGWAAIYRIKADKVFLLSDHCDFYDLLFYIEQSSPKEVLFFSGKGEKLARVVKKENEKIEIKQI